MERWQYLYPMKRPFLAMLFLFFAFTFIGYLAGGELSAEFMEALREFYGGVQELTAVEFVVFIFINNAGKSFLVMLLGVFFGIPPLLFISLNGLTIGLVAFETVKREGFFFLLAAILPHGVLELPAVILGSAIGLKFGFMAVRKLRGERGLGLVMKEGFLFFALRILPLLFLAAVIEVFVTPALLQTFFG